MRDHFVIYRIIYTYIFVSMQYRWKQLFYIYIFVYGPFCFVFWFYYVLIFTNWKLFAMCMVWLVWFLFTEYRCMHSTAQHIYKHYIYIYVVYNSSCLLFFFLFIFDLIQLIILFNLTTVYFYNMLHWLISNSLICHSNTLSLNEE